jgi:hypothetical protein
MQEFTRYIEKRIDESKVLNEATSIQVTKEAYLELHTAIDSLSDVFTLMNKKGVVDGGGMVPDLLRKVEVAIQKAKDKTKVAGKQKSTDKFEPSTKKVLGEIGSSLEKIAERLRVLAETMDGIEPEMEIDDVNIDDDIPVEDEPIK